MMSQVVLFAYRIMLNISRRELQKFRYQGGYIVILSDLCNAIKKTFDKIWLHRHFKLVYLLMNVYLFQNIRK